MEGRLMKWGNSYGLLIKKEEVVSRGLKQGEVIEMEIRKKQDLSQLFGMCKFKRPMKEIMKDIHESYDE